MEVEHSDGERRELTCPRCKKPTGSGRHGTITQWISACDCELQASGELDAAPEVDLCIICGKRRNVGRAGSLTQWIFRADCCDCAAPNFISPSGERFSLPPLSNRDLPTQKLLPLTGIGFISSQRYIPLKVLGTGASGKVFLASDLFLDRLVAVKKLNWTSSGNVIDFQHEAQTTCKLNHPNIVSVLDLSIDDNGVPFMVMEFVDGISLDNALRERKGPMAVSQAVDLLIEICQALSYAHRVGVLHRDVKSSNILLTIDHAYLIDFGVAKFKEKFQKSQGTMSDTIAGSPGYMSPDTSIGECFDERSEVYSLGCVLFESLTGRLPFVADTPLELLAMHVNMRPPALADVCDGIFPDVLEGVVARCLAKSKKDRYQSVEELEAALKDVNIVGVSHDSAGERTPSGRAEKRPLRRAVSLKLFGMILAFGIAGSVISWRLLHDEKYVAVRAANSHSFKKAHEFNGADRREVIANLVKSDQTDVTLASGFLQDQDLIALSGYDKITSLNLKGNPVTENGMKHVNAPYLRTLKLANTDVKSLEFLKRFPRLESLHVGFTEISDDSLRFLRDLPMLSQLRLSDNKGITDQSVDTLSKLYTLTALDVRNTSLSKESLDRLAERMPMTSIMPNHDSKALFIVRKMNEQYGLEHYSVADKLAQDLIGKIEAAQGTESPRLIEFLLVRADCANVDGDSNQAVRLVHRAVAIARKSRHDNLLIRALGQRRQLESERNEFDKAVISQDEICAAIIRADGPVSQRLDDELFFEGELLVGAHKSKEAVEVLTKFLERREGEKKDLRTVWALSGLGRAHMEMHEYEKARMIYQQAISLVKQFPLTNKKQMAKYCDLLCCMGVNYQGEGNLQMAEQCYRRSLTIATRCVLHGRIYVCKQRIAALKDHQRQP